MRFGGMPEPAFLLDAMLGSLARWLRIMGYDSVYRKDAADRDLLNMRGDRTLLTRDKQLAQRAGSRGFYMESDDLDLQLAAGMESFGLRYDLERTRCTACNGELENVAKDEIRDEVDEGTWNCHDEFWRCRNCHKVYWHGAHWKSIMRRLEKVSRGPGSSPR
jgi:uncharacterized protein with PIN domain